MIEGVSVTFVLMGGIVTEGVFLRDVAIEDAAPASSSVRGILFEGTVIFVIEGGLICVVLIEIGSCMAILNKCVSLKSVFIQSSFTTSSRFLLLKDVVIQELGIVSSSRTGDSPTILGRSRDVMIGYWALESGFSK